MTVRIAIASDDRYALPLAACVRSVLDNAGDIQVVILSCGISDASRSKLVASWDEKKNLITWIELDQSVFSHLPTTSRIQKHLSAATYARLLLPDVVPRDWERVLFLDTDTITSGSLQPLWDTPLEGHPLAAVKDPYNPRISSEAGVSGWRDLGLNPDGVYFNAGVMLMDLARWRTERISEKCLSYVLDHRETVLTADQEGLNAAANGRFKALDPIWNVMTYWYLLDNGDDADEAIVEGARIRHFNGSLKPWSSLTRTAFEEQKTRHLYGSGRQTATNLRRPDLDFDIFFESLDRTEWRGWRPSPQCVDDTADH